LSKELYDPIELDKLGVNEIDPVVSDVPIRVSYNIFKLSVNCVYVSE
jgi:hypothetical protein